MTIQQMLLGASGAAGADGWEIIMATNLHKSTSGNNSYYGYTGNSNFKSITESSTGANNRTAVGDGVGLYSAFFNMTGITKMALASNHKGGAGLDPSVKFNEYIIYDLVSTTSSTLYSTINSLDTYNINASNWAGQDDSSYYNNSVTTFVAGDYESGNMSSHSNNYRTNNSQIPDKFVIWGINYDSDNDAQVLCAYHGTLAPGNGKGDSWRGSSPQHTFWSYWGNDWYSDTRNHTISRSTQTQPGLCGSGATGSYIYLLAFKP